VGIATTSSSKVMAMPIPIVDLNSQNRTVEICTEIRQVARDHVALLDRQLSLLHERKQALITAAVSGQLDVTTARRVEVS
jgi:type I restriction enzyme S subunit